MGTAKKFYTSIASLSHTSKKPGHEAAHGGRRRGAHRRHSRTPALRPVQLIARTNPSQRPPLWAGAAGKEGNERFSGRGHAAHICKKCAALPAAQRAEDMTLTKLWNLPWQLSAQQRDWLKVSDQLGWEWKGADDFDAEQFNALVQAVYVENGEVSVRRLARRVSA